MKKLIVFSIILSLAAACTWENEEELYPDPGLCDTLDVSYSEDVVPILANNCYACHSNANGPDFGRGNTWEDYEDVVASANTIVGAINHEDGFPSMPREADQLDTCSISIIEAWVNAGTPNN